jgi:hypothetical protein
MVKTGTQRSDKYNAKFDATVIGARYTATRDIAVAGQLDQQGKLALVADAVRTALNDAGIPAMFTMPYMAFGNKLYAIARKFGGTGITQNAVDEAWIALCHWYSLGCLPSPLQQIWGHFPTLGTAPSPLAFPEIPE